MGYGCRGYVGGFLSGEPEWGLCGGVYVSGLGRQKGLQAEGWV